MHTALFARIFVESTLEYCAEYRWIDFAPVKALAHVMNDNIERFAIKQWYLNIFILEQAAVYVGEIFKVRRYIGIAFSR